MLTKVARNLYLGDKGTQADAGHEDIMKDGLLEPTKSYTGELVPEYWLKYSEKGLTGNLNF